MFFKKCLVSTLIGVWIALPLVNVLAQETVTTNPDQAKEQAALEKKALDLLDQTIADGRALKLPENRCRVQFTTGDLLWTRDEKRARALFTEAAASCAEFIRSIDVNSRRGDQLQTAVQLRQEMLSTVARRDPELALEFLRSSRLPTPAQTDRPGMRGGGRPDQDANLEASLLAQLAANDPKLAARLAEEALDKGEFSGRLAQLLTQLQAKDKAAGDKLAEKMVRRLKSENFTTNQNARLLAINLLGQGPRTAAGAQNAQPNQSSSRAPVLDEAIFREMLEALVAAGMNVTQSATPANDGGRAGNRGPNQFGRGFGQFGQNGGMALLTSLQSLLPQIDKYLPGRSTAVHQKLTEMGINTAPRGPSRSELNTLVEQGSSDSILQAASSAPPEMQGRLYRQAALKALEEENPEQASKIADEHLTPEMRTRMQQEIERQKLVRSAVENKIEEARAVLAAMRSDEDRLTALTQMATAVGQAGNRKLALQLLDEAGSIAWKRAENYQQMEGQLKLSAAYATLDPLRSLTVLEPGIYQINEMLAAAILLNGFEVRLFKDGEMPLQGGSQLSEMISSFGERIGALARVQFDAAQATAERFQRPEARIVVRLSIVRGVLETTH